MADTEKPDQGQAEDSSEISLDNIDEILSQEDPDFVDSLSDIKEAGDEAQDVELETLDIDIGDGGNYEDKESRFEAILSKLLKKYPKLKGFAKALGNSKKFLRQRWLIWRDKAKLWFFNSLEHIKTWPERSKKLASDSKRLLGVWSDRFREGFGSRSGLEKSLILTLVFGCGIVAGLVVLNVSKSNWVPFLTPSLMTSPAEVADQSWEFNMETGTLPFLTAFPQEKHSYLFPKVVVNLKTKPGENSFQMGAFEFFVEVDSKDTAIEVKSRQVELHDLMQRVTEGFSYEVLQSQRGKERLKEELKQALNKKIVQGWVKEVYIKFFITKP